MTPAARSSLVAAGCSIPAAKGKLVDSHLEAESAGVPRSSFVLRCLDAGRPGRGRPGKRRWLLAVRQSLEQFPVFPQFAQGGERGVPTDLVQVVLTRTGDLFEDQHRRLDLPRKGQLA